MKAALVISFSGIIVAASGAAAAESQARIRVTDAYGTSIGAAKITLSSPALQLNPKPDEVIRLPYGSYDLKVEVPGFRSTSMTVRINQPEQLVAVGLKLGSIDGPVPVCMVTGSVAPKGVVGQVRLQQLFGDYQGDVPLGAGGSFKFLDIECGDYLIVLIGGGKCLGTKTVRAQMSPQPISMKIAAESEAGCTTVRE